MRAPSPRPLREDLAQSRFADQMNPATVEPEHIGDLRAIATAVEAVRADEAELQKAVEAARAHGRSWNQIALALDVSRQAARQRFGDKVST